MIESMDGVGVIMGETEVVLHIVGLEDELISLRKLHSFEKVWKIFVDFNSVSLDGESKFAKFITQNFDGNEQNESNKTHKECWESLIYSHTLIARLTEVMPRQWGVIGVGDVESNAFKDLSVAEHPVCVA